MRFKPFHLKRAAALMRGIDDDAVLTAVYGEGGGSTLSIIGSATATLVCIPLRGSVQVSHNDLTWSVFAGEALIAEYAPRATVVGHGKGKWIGLTGAKRAWAQVLPPAAASGGQLLPDLHKADREMRRLAIAVARSANSTSLEGAVNALADKLASTQSELHAAIARCPGRTWINKRQVFLRLQRVRNYICAYCERELDIGELARMANYSPCHFLRTFHVVYQTTPHAYLVDQRLQRAWRMLRSGSFAVTEVAVASGFENRSAFSRLFHQRFGATAQETRCRPFPTAA